MKKFGITTLFVMFTVCLTVTLTLFFADGIKKTEVSTLAANKALYENGLRNVTSGSPSTLFTENKSGAISYLKITIPIDETSKSLAIEQFITTTHEVTADEKNPLETIPSTTSTTAPIELYFTRSAHYKVTIGTAVYECDFSPIFVRSNIAFLTAFEENFYALTSGTYTPTYDTSLYTISLESIENDHFGSSSLSFTSEVTGEVFTLPFTILTSNISFEFSDSNDNPVSTSWINDSSDSEKYNIFNQSVKAKVVVTTSGLTEGVKNEILSHFTFAVTGGEEDSDYEKIDSNTFLFYESHSKTFYITKKFGNENAQKIGGDENYIKIETKLPSDSTLSITFSGSTAYDYIENYFSQDGGSAIINAENSTIFTAGPKALNFSKETIAGQTEYVKSVGNFRYYTYEKSGVRSAFKFEVKFHIFATELSGFITSGFLSLTDESSYPSGNYPSYDTYSFRVNTTGFNSILKLRLTYNGIVYEYAFDANIDKTIKLSQPGNYVIEFYGMNDYETLRNSWLSANSLTSNEGFDNYYTPLKNYNNGSRAFSALKRSFRIKGAYATAQTEDGSYLFDNEFTNSSSVLVNIYNDTSMTYEVFKNNEFVSSSIENITTTGAVFSEPGRWTIRVYNILTKKYSSISFTIVNSSYQYFSFFSNPETNEDMKVKNVTKDKLLANPANHVYHIGDEGEYLVTSTYNSIFTLDFVDEANDPELKSASKSIFEFEIKPSKFAITLKTGKNGDRITENVVIESVTTNIKATKMEVYLDGKLVRTYNANYVYYFSQVPAGDRTFTSNGTYTIVIYDEYNNSYQLQITKYYKMKTATVILLVLAGLALGVGGYFAFRIRRGVKVK